MTELGRIGMLGGGNMGSALIRGMLSAQAANAGQIVVAEQDPERDAAPWWKVWVWRLCPRPGSWAR